MNPFREFDIAFVGLKSGKHRFHYDINEHFFQLFEHSPLSRSSVSVDLDFDKKNTFFLLNFQISGTINVPCDRCADEIDFPIDADFPLVVKFDEHRDDINDDSNADVVYISHSESVLNVAQLVYEFVILSVPFGRITCESVPAKGKCNPKTLKILNHLTRDSDHQPDHRWDSLKKIKNK